MIIDNRPWSSWDDVARLAGFSLGMVEERGAKPAAGKRTGNHGGPGIIRIDFPGYSDGDSLEKISWDKWFEKFEESKLALLSQERTCRRERSNFTKLVCRDT